MHKILRAAVLLVAALASSGACAQGASRAGKYELSLSPIISRGQTYNFANGASVDTDVGWGLGFQWAYNFSNQFSAGLETQWTSADYKATVGQGNGNVSPGFNYNSRVDMSTWRLMSTYNFSPKAFTGFVTGGLGVTWTDSNVPSGPTQPVCWWYPYYGQVCSGVTPTKTSTDFSYNLGLGARYDTPGPNPYFFRGLINRTWVDFGGYGGTRYTDNFRFDFGVKF